MLYHPFVIGLIILTVLYLIVMGILFVRYRAASRQLAEQLRKCEGTAEDSSVSSETDV